MSGADPAGGGGGGDMFLMVKGASHGVIKGESQDDAHKGEIEILSWSWGMQGHAGAAGGRGRVGVQELKIVKRIDSASTALMGALRSNEVIQKAVLTLRKAGKGQQEYLRVTVERGHVTSLSIEAGDRTGSPQVFEHVSFSFNKITIDYLPQGKDGQLLGGMTWMDEWGR